MRVTPEITTQSKRQELLASWHQRQTHLGAEAKKKEAPTKSAKIPLYHPLRSALGRVAAVGLIVTGVGLAILAFKAYQEGLESSEAFNFVDESWNSHKIASPLKKLHLNGDGADTGSPFRYDKPIEPAIEVGNNPFKLAFRLTVDQKKSSLDYSGGLGISNAQPRGPAYREIILEKTSDNGKEVWELKYVKGQYDDFETILVDDQGYYVADANSDSETFLIGLEEDWQTGSIAIAGQSLEKRFKIYEPLFEGEQRSISVVMRATPNTETTVSRLEVYTPKIGQN